MAANKGTDMAELEVGQKAPQFQLPRDGGGVVKLSDFEGKPVVLYFYPQDDTQTCTAEAIDFSRLEREFAKLGAQVIGVSPDSIARHEKFKKKHKLTIGLASDEEQKTLNAYGNYMGVVRTTFLIGRDGRIARIWRNVRVRGHAQEVLEVARALP